MWSSADPTVFTTWSVIFDTAVEIGLPIAENKTASPCSALKYLGFWIDTVVGTVTIPIEKQRSIVESLDTYLAKSKVTLRETQVILGKLAFVARVLPLSRPFLRRIYIFLSVFRSIHHHHRVPRHCRLDLQMWKKFFVTPLAPLKIFNRSFVSNFDLELFSDASGSFGFGAILGSSWFASSWGGHFPVEVQENQMTFLEFFPLVVAIVIWGKRLRGRKIRYHCDNLGLVHILNKKTSASVRVLSLLRFFVLHCVLFDIELVAAHIPGSKNNLCDLLSRGEFLRFRALFPSADSNSLPIPDFLWNL